MNLFLILTMQFFLISSPTRAAIDIYTSTLYDSGDTVCEKNSIKVDCLIVREARQAGATCQQTQTISKANGINNVTTITTCELNTDSVNANKGGFATSDSKGVSPDTNASQNWEASKYNSQEILRSELEKESAPNQKDAYTLQSNILYGCVDKSLNGRTDSVCASSPDHPECVGLSKSLGFATTCVEMFEPASLGCKVYGSKGYAMDDWIGFGGQYFNSLQACATRKTKSDELVPRLVNMEQIEMVQFKANGPLGAGISFLKNEPQSDLSQSKSDGSSNQEPLQIQDLNKLIQENPDGAGYLGYDEGELIKRAVKGESYVQVILDSPFADKLKADMKDKLETAASDPNETARSALAKKGLEPGSLAATQEGNDRISSNGGLSPNAISASAPALAANTLPYYNYSQTLTQDPGTAPSPESKQMESQIKEALAPENNTKRPLLADRIAALETMAKNASKLQGRGLASISEEQESAPAMEDSSLFERISLAYKKRHLGLRSQESITGKAVRSMDQPAFFKEL